MFGFIRKMFIATMTFVGCGRLILSNPLKLVSSKLCVPDVIKNMNVKIINLLKHLILA